MKGHMSTLSWFCCTAWTCLLIIVYPTHGTDVWKEFFHVRGAAIVAGQSRSEGNAVSRADCASRCIECPVVTYDDVAMTCTTYSELNSTLTPSTEVTTRELWISRAIPAFPVQASDANPISEPEATSLCADLGGRLALSQPDFFELHQAGLHLCSCGMLGSGIVRYSVQVEDADCPVGSFYPDIPTCKTGGVYPERAPITYCTFRTN